MKQKRIKWGVAALSMLMSVGMGATSAFGYSEQIALEGNNGDWSKIPVYAQSEDGGVLKVTSDSSKIYFMASGPVQSKMTQIFIDTDNDANTGFKTSASSDWSVMGFDTMVQTYINDQGRQSYIYKYENGEFKKKTSVSECVALSEDAKVLEVGIPKTTLLGSIGTESFRFAYKNSDPAGGSPCRMPKRGLASVRFLYSPEDEMAPKNFSDTFTSLHKKGWTYEVANSGVSDSIKTNLGSNGTTCLRMELNDTDTWVVGGNRSERVLGRAEQFRMYQYEFSTYLPKNDPSPNGFINDNGGEIIAQWHNCPDPGEGWTQPPLALRTAKGQYYLDLRSDQGEMSTDSTLAWYKDAIQTGPLKGSMPLASNGSTYYGPDQGKWIKWKFKIRWDWRPVEAGGKGLIEVYKDNVKVRTITGPNITNDLYGPTFKIGIYKFFAKPNDAHNGYAVDDQGNYVEPWSTVHKRVIYYDNVIVKEVW